MHIHFNPTPVYYSKPSSSWTPQIHHNQSPQQQHLDELMLFDRIYAMNPTIQIFISETTTGRLICTDFVRGMKTIH